MLNIALTNGFNSLEYFSEMCKKITGASPTTIKNYLHNRNNIDEDTKIKITNSINNLYNISNIKKDVLNEVENVGKIDDDKEIINRYHGLSRIEDSFRIMKSDLEGRPVFVWTEEHIRAHFLICFIALTIIRLIQYKLLKFQNKSTLNVDGWEQGITADKLKQTLKKFKADKINDEFFKISEINDDMKNILNSFDINFKFKDYTFKEIKELRKMINNIDL